MCKETAQPRRGLIFQAVKGDRGSFECLLLSGFHVIAGGNDSSVKRRNRIIEEMKIPFMRDLVSGNSHRREEAKGERKADVSMWPQLLKK